MLAMKLSNTTKTSKVMALLHDEKLGTNHSICILFHTNKSNVKKKLEVEAEKVASTSFLKSNNLPAFSSGNEVSTNT